MDDELLQPATDFTTTNTTASAVRTPCRIDEWGAATDATEQSKRDATTSVAASRAPNYRRAAPTLGRS